MSWIGLNDATRAIFRPAGLAALTDSGRPTNAVGNLLVRGSLVIEATIPSERERELVLLRYDRTQDWRRRLVIALDPENRLSVSSMQGLADSRATVRVHTSEHETLIRITYAFDAPKRTGLLTVETPERGVISQVEFRNPHPWPMEDLERIALNRAPLRIAEDVDYLALSTRIVPVGLSPGLVEGTPIDTIDGPRPIERLRLGDEILVAGQDPKPVRWIVRREVPSSGHFKPVRLRAPYFGLRHDIFVAPDHRMLIGGAGAEYLFGESTVLAEARHLMDGRAAVADHSPRPVVTYLHVLLDEHCCIGLGGASGESLFVGTLGTSPELLATTPLAGMTSTAMPRHTRLASVPLHQYQAQALVRALGM